MSDRKLKVERLDDGTVRLSGVAYEADKPNVNGVIYPKAVLKKAMEDFMAKDFRPVTYGCEANATLRKTVGLVESAELEDDKVVMTAKTLETSRGEKLAEVCLATDVAFACAGMGKVSDSKVLGDDFTILSVGVVPLPEVEPKKE
jgi:hypothetical protein